MTTGLLDAALVRELDALRRQLRVKTRAGLAGGISAPRTGSAVEFEEHRPYTPGDDASRIDWLAFARTGQPFLKRHRADEDAVVRVIVDASASLGFGTPTKVDTAARLAAAISYLALAAGERAAVVVASGRGLRTSSTRRGRGGLPPLLRELSSLAAEGPLDLADAVTRTVAQAKRPGLLVVVSDFLGPGSFEDALRRARFAGHDIALVQVLSKEELEPSLEGDVALEDAETGATLELTVDARAVRAYLERLEALTERLRKTARENRGTFVRCRTDEPTVGAVRRLLERRNA